MFIGRKCFQFNFKGFNEGHRALDCFDSNFFPNFCVCFDPANSSEQGR